MKGHTIKKVYIEPGCISCGTCEAVCPQVFKVTDVSHVNQQADLQSNADLIEEAAEICPVSVIKYEK
jgi:ferredoxin